MTGSPVLNPQGSPPPTPASRNLAAGTVYFRSDSQGLHLHLPAGMDWDEVWESLIWQLRSRKPFWAGATPLTLWSQDWELDLPTLQTLSALVSQYQLQLRRVQTTIRSTAIAAATLGYSVEQSSPLEAIPPVPTDTTPLYLRSTVRSGTAVRHSGSVFLLGDLNPGGEIIAGGDIWVWGRLRGVVHAGANGDEKALILALQLDPTQLRIADQVARPPEAGSLPNTPEVVYLQDNVICIATIQDFLRREV
ncbi:septum site-determining protein MinC [Thermostichus vulcanus]|uniref:Probable septum site-determining protein MinC n=1 Tax=Thermostichus vulcanus str. 'Rupite' TaxID=2813851 RepID=A0ABT0CCA3_THEVL|nr:septum site-determining protein MinC [Thermostichus vulcanus]MCJ2543421.1 septum site-determining protein MinC [Thermostichus vulcanus str. 'Rupite']